MRLTLFFYRTVRCDFFHGNDGIPGFPVGQELFAVACPAELAAAAGGMIDRAKAASRHDRSFVQPGNAINPPLRSGLTTFLL